MIKLSYRGKADWTNNESKSLYHLTIFVIINKILNTKNRRMLIFSNFLLKYYQLYRKTASDKNCLFSSHRVLRIFSVPHFLMLVKIDANKKIVLKSWQKILKKFLQTIIFIYYIENTFNYSSNNSFI